MVAIDLNYDALFQQGLQITNLFGAFVYYHSTMIAYNKVYLQALIAAL
jgi:hypothetical protein